MRPPNSLAPLRGSHVALSEDFLGPVLFIRIKAILAAFCDPGETDAREVRATASGGHIVVSRGGRHFPDAMVGCA
jgi:hypothetical protein